MGKKVYLTFETSLTDICEVNSSFDRGLLRVCYAGENRNKSYIAKEDLERCVKTLPYVPVVGNYIRENEDFGGHDVEIITASDGQLKMVNKTQPVGVVPADANIYFETIIDNNGNEKEYLYTTVLLWKRQEAYQKIKEEGIISHSMEITVKDGESINGIYHIYDFEFTALCLLGSNVEPCFEDSSLEVFTTSDFKSQFELMMNDFKESFNLATTSIEDNIIKKETLEKGGEEDLEMNKDVFAEDETIDVKPVSEEFAEEVEENVEVKEEDNEESFEAKPEEQDESEDDDAEKDDDVDDGDNKEKDFALMMEISNSLCETLCSTDRIQEGEYDWCRYFFIDFDHDAGVVYFEDAVEDWKLFGCNYLMDGDNVVIDFESKRRMKYIIVEFDEGSAEDQNITLFETVQKDSENRIESKYQEKIKECEEELATLREFKEGVDAAEEINARNEIISEFNDLVGVKEFSTLCDNMLDYDVETLREKLYAIRGRNMSNPASANFSIDEGMPKFIVESNGVRSNDIHADAPYGGLVEKYLNV